MQIFGILFNISQPSFEAGYPKRVFYDARDIPNLPCARCGKKMLPKLEAENFLSKIRPSLRRCLKKLQSLKDIKEYQLLEELAEKYPRENIDQILSHQSSFASKPINKQIPEFIINRIKAVTFNASAVVRKLQKYRKYMSETNLELLDIMEIYAKKYPNLTLLEIITHPEVYGYHKRMVKMEKDTLEVKSQRVFKRMERIAEKMGKGKNEELKVLNLETLRVIQNRTNYDDTDECLENLYEDFISKINNRKDADKFKKLVKELPFAKTNPHRIIVKAAENHSPFGIIYHFFDRTNTFEHIKPKSQKGVNLQHNGIYMCADCNTKRGTTPYKKLFLKSADFGTFVQKQASMIMRYIMRGKLIRYDFYPQEVKKTLYEESGHIFKLDIKKYLKSQIEKSQAEIQKRKESCKKADEELRQIKKELTNLIQRQNALNSNQAKNNQKLIYEENKLNNYRQSLHEEENYG
ncbi:hypothetical protein IKQ21_00405 [bacterium]|nr:hypothetical protein [bacterium]